MLITNGMKKWALRLCLIIFIMRWGYAQTPVDVQLKMEHILIMFPEAKSLVVPEDENKWVKVLDGEGNILGGVTLTSPYADHITGHDGPVPLLIGADVSGKINGIIILPNSETPDFIDHLQKKGFVSSFTGLSLKEVVNSEYDTVSGATLSSGAIIKTIKHRLKMMENSSP